MEVGTIIDLYEWIIELSTVVSELFPQSSFPHNLQGDGLACTDLQAVSTSLFPSSIM